LAVRSRSSIIGSIAVRAALLGAVITGTLSGEVPARDYRDGGFDPVSLLSLHSRNAAVTRFQTTLESGVLPEWQPGAINIQEKSSSNESGITSGPITTTPTGHIDASTYLGGPDDTGARRVLGRQAQVDKLIARTSDITRRALFEEAKKGSSWNEATAEAHKHFAKSAEDLLRSLLFTGEAQVRSQLQEATDFQRNFEQSGPFDRRGRSLRDLDQQTRAFRYPCSYLIYSDEWDALAEPAKGYLYHRLHEVLTGKDQSPEFSQLTSDKRSAILEILLDTKPDLPPEWKQSRGQKHHARAELHRVRSALSTN
jgi:hypothetical protein